MGSTHVTMAMIGGALTLPIATASGLNSAYEQAAWIIVWGGAGLAPDLDHPRAHAARMWGPISAALAVAVSRIAGGHRKGTHDLILAPLAAATATGAALSSGSAWAAGAVLALTIGLALRGLQAIDLGRTAEGTNLAISVSGAWFLVAHDDLDQLALLPLAFAGGWLSHLLGDALTDERLPMPIGWLFGRDQRIGLPLMATGKTVELLLWAPVMAAVLLWLLADIAQINSFGDLQRTAEHVLRASFDSAPTVIREIWRTTGPLLE